MTGGNGQQPQPPEIPPGPVPMRVNVEGQVGPKGRRVVLSFITAQGEQFFFMDSEPAMHVGRAIIAAASGLVLPDGPLPPQPGG